MAATCYHCDKKTMYGRSHTHHRGVAGGRWKKRAQKTNRIFKPNFQSVWVIEAGEKVHAKLCMKCLKRIKKDITDGEKPFLELAYPASQLKALIDKAQKARVKAVPAAV